MRKPPLPALPVSNQRKKRKNYVDPSDLLIESRLTFTDLPVRVGNTSCESRPVIASAGHRGCSLRTGALNEDVHESPGLCRPIVCAARARDPIDGAKHVHWIDIWPKISASDGAAR
jgi:hypothetical protein